MYHHTITLNNGVKIPQQGFSKKADAEGYEVIVATWHLYIRYHHCYNKTIRPECGWQRTRNQGINKPASE